jgi:TonB family protein
LFRAVFISRQTLEDEPSVRIILEHELVHIRRYHSLDNLLAGVILAIHWFNPFMYLIQNELKRVHEYEADSRAIEKTGSYQDYQTLLFQQTFGVPYLSPVNNFNSSIKKRLLMLRKSNSSRNFSRVFVFIPLAVALIFAFACSENNNSDSPNKSGERVEEIVAKKSEASKKASEDVFIVVEDMPKFQGGTVADFRKYVQQKLTYPEEAKEKGLEGTSYVKFIVDEEGRVDEVEVIRSSHDILDQAAVDVIRNSPEWEPGKQRGKKVKVQFTVPMVFKLSDGS